LHYDTYIKQVEERIQAACLRSGRDRDDVRIVAVSKYLDVTATQSLLSSGMNELGENRWQNAKEKWEAIGGQASWHFIGHLQTNKVKDVVGKFDYIHSLDRSSLLHEIQRQAEKLQLIVSAFIQLNVSGEMSKYGMPPEALIDFAKETLDCPNVRIIGLMTMAPHEEEPERTRPVFRRLRELRDELAAAHIWPEPVNQLSMGMSNDFEIAVEEGATLLRLGSVLIGR